MMRIVQYQKNTQTPVYRALWTLGVIGAVFTVVVAAFLIANNLRIRSTDPIHSPALQRLVQELKATPQNDTLKEQIRELDLLARRAFFTSQRFNHIAAWLLLGGGLVTVVAFKTLASYHRRAPLPDSSERKDDLAANARWARQSVTAVGLVLVGLALSLALPWKSTLDRPPPEWVTPPATVAPKATGNPTATHAPDAHVLSTPATLALATSIVNSAALPLASAPAETATAAAGPPPASRAEQLKHWSSFRGPADGHAAATRLPTQWDGASGTGIVWKTALPLPGFSSPIIWGDHIFLSGGDEKRRAVFAVDARAGKVEWERAVPAAGTPATPVPEVMADTGHAAASMATDGTRVFAVFSTGDLAAFGLDGQPAWSQRLGTPVNPYGHSSSLAVFEDLLLVQYDQKTNSFAAGFDVRNGALRWRVERSFGPSWASPALIETSGRTELVLVADAFVTGHDPRTGRELWRVKALANADVAPSPIVAHGLLYVAADHVKFAAVDLKTHHAAWENKETTPGVGTPVAVGEWIFAGLSEGGIACWDARSGKVLWQHETDDGFYASPIAAGGRVYVMDRTGRMFIFEADGAAFKAVSQPMLGEESVATPAVYAESLIVRGVKHLFRIGGQ